MKVVKTFFAWSSLHPDSKYDQAYLLKSPAWIIGMSNIVPVSTFRIDDVDKKHGSTKVMKV